MVNEKNLKGNPLKTKLPMENPINDGKPGSYKRNLPKTKVTITGDSLIKYLRRDNLSSKNNDVDTHPESTTVDMLDYIKPTVRRKPDVLVIHTGTNNLTNGVNTMKEVRQLVKCVKELDKEEEVKIGFLSVINRSDRNLEKGIIDPNHKLKRYCEGNHLFIDNNNINKSCLNNSKLHLNKEGTNILCQNIRKSPYDY